MANSALWRLIFPLCALVCGCGKSVQQPLEQTTEESYKVNEDVNFSIRSTDGSIRIYGSNVAEISVQAIKKAFTAERLNKIAVDVSVQPDGVSIETTFPPKQSWGFSDRSGTVDYTIVIPQAAQISRLELANGEVLVEGMRSPNVHAALGNGRLFGHNCFGNIDLAVTSGNLTLAYDWWEQRKFSVNATIATGNIWAFIPGDAAFHVIAKSVRGNIVNDFAEKQERQAGRLNKIDMLVHNGAESDIKIQATDGNVKIAETNP
jgi:hypothetical protein